MQVKFRIYELDISNVVVVGVDKTYTYTGARIEPARSALFKVYSGKDKKTELSEWNPESQNGAYEIVYGENTDAGSGYVILNGKGKSALQLFPCGRAHGYDPGNRHGCNDENAVLSGRKIEFCKTESQKGKEQP